MNLPEDDRYLQAKSKFEAEISGLLAGRASEQLVFGEVTTGAGNDLERATELARKMVCEWGMSEMGPLTFGKREEAIFLGKEFARHQDYSETTAVAIDHEIKALVNGAYARTEEILRAHRPVLDRIAEALLEHEVLEGEQVYAMLSDHTGLPVEKLKGPGKPVPVADPTSA
jgi:cell division protease FtsH